MIIVIIIFPFYKVTNETRHEMERNKIHAHTSLSSLPPQLTERGITRKRHTTGSSTTLDTYKTVHRNDDDDDDDFLGDGTGGGKNAPF